MRTTQGAVGAAYDVAPTADDVHWQLKGLCRTMDPNFFQPLDEKGARRVKVVCRTCPVVMECREWGLFNHEESGVWGALSEKDRQAVWRQQRLTGDGLQRLA